MNLIMERLDYRQSIEIVSFTLLDYKYNNKILISYMSQKIDINKT